MFPIVMNLTRLRCVVVGGGPVGRRKADALVAAGAEPCIVCPLPRPPGIHPQIDWRPEPYRIDHLDGVALVFAAATPPINEQVVADARARGVLVSSASDPDNGDFFVPATIRRGDFILAISTAGSAPALAAEVRRRLGEQFDDTFGQWVGLLGDLRPIILAQVAQEETRQTLFAQLSHWDWLERLRREGVESVRSAMLAEVSKALRSGADPV